GMKPPGAVEGFLSDEMSTGPTFIKSGYTFSLAGVGLQGAPASCNGLPAGSGSAGYAVIGDPLDQSAPARFLGSHADGLVFEDTGSFAATMTETGAPSNGQLIH